jgi:hypothetical protein
VDPRRTVQHRVVVLAAVLFVVATVVLVLTAGACDQRTPLEQDPGIVVQIVTSKTSDQVTLIVKRDSNGTAYDAGPYDGTACVVGDHWPECY